MSDEQPVDAEASAGAEIASLPDHDGQLLVSTQTMQHDYITQNGKVVRETITTDGAVTAIMDFIYDESGRPFALSYTNGTSTPDVCYYVLNLQGDVVGLVNSSGGWVAQYTYNAWGEILTSTGTMADINPLRYRSYYYDTETGFYYLQSRYYDPVTHRFINADSYQSTGQGIIGTNMFAYCLNNPVVFGDAEGTDAIILIDDDLPLKVGHVGFLVQDEEGNWIHFYWGPYGWGGTVYCFTLSFVYPETWAVTYDGELTLDAINESEAYNGDYDRMIYLEGDFSKSARSAKKASILRRKGLYHLTLNNCSQVSFALLAQSETPYQELLQLSSEYVVPCLAFNDFWKQVGNTEERCTVKE